MSINTITELRIALTKQFELAILDKCNPKKLGSLSSCASQIIKSAQTEMAYCQMLNKKPKIRFIEPNATLTQIEAEQKLMAEGGKDE